MPSTIKAWDRGHRVIRERRHLRRILIDKADDSIYDGLEDKVEVALLYARKLEGINLEAGRRRENPSTKVHLLIAALRKLSPESLGMDVEA